MIHALFDTNVLASGFARSNPLAAPTLLLERWEAGRFTLVTSERVLAELANTFQRGYFAERLSAERAAADIALLRQRADVTPLSVTVSGVASHPEDDLILAAALSAKVDYLVTGDRALLKLGAYERIPIVTAVDFLAALDAIAE